ncbi:MAG: methylated-DNA--[protein]-cysteine S-methyltransferase [Firmicutes bacterium]|nr:methylated-DNA--[protein]-cysteine S-methyltransferase [Bacillota bacterium]
MEFHIPGFGKGFVFWDEEGFLRRVILPGQKGVTEETVAVEARRSSGTHPFLPALAAYLQGRRRDLVFPYRVEGTDFQQRVWRALTEIPYGETRTYKEIAAATGSPGAARAVGQACGANPLPLLIPCHRVVATGGLGGFGGGEQLKKYLLRLEGVKI